MNGAVNDPIVDDDDDDDHDDGDEWEDVSDSDESNPDYIDVPDGTMLLAVDDLVKAFHADVNAKNKYGQTPLMIAMQGYYNPVCPFIKVLLEGGALVNERDNKGHTALYYAQESLKSGKLKDRAAIDMILNTGATL